MPTQLPLTILMINKFLFPFSGVESVVFAEKDLLEAHGHRVILFGMEHPQNQPSSWSRYFVSRVDYSDQSVWSRLRASARALYSIEARRKLHRLLAEIKPDVAHIHHIYHQISPSVLFELRAAGIPTVQTVHDYKPICPNAKMFVPREDRICFRCKGSHFYWAALTNCGTYGRASSVMIAIEAYLTHLTRIYLRAVHHFLTPSAFLRARLVEGGLPAERVEVLPNFVRCADSAAESQPHQPTLVLFVGRLERYKGVYLLLEAAQRLSEVTFILVGSGSEEDALHRRAQSLPNVRLLGKQPYRVVREWMQQALCLVVPSLWHDVAPQVVLEAFAVGLPVLATPVGGLPELVRTGINGILLSAPTADSIIAGVRMLMSDPALRHQLSIGASRTAKAYFTPEQHYQRLIQVYDKIRQACGR